MNRVECGCFSQIAAVKYYYLLLILFILLPGIENKCGRMMMDFFLKTLAHAMRYNKLHVKLMSRKHHNLRSFERILFHFLLWIW